MEIKNSQISIIESSLNELHKILHDKDSKTIQLQKEKEYLKDSITNNKYEFESISEENEKLKKQIKNLYEKQNDLKEDIQEKTLEIKTLENTKKQSEKIIQTKNNSLLHSMEEKLFESNQQIKEKDNHLKELQSRNEYLQNIIELHNNEEEVLQYDNSSQKKQIKMLRETINKHEKQIKKYEYNEMMSSSNNKLEKKHTNFIKSNKNLEVLEEKIKISKKNTPEKDIIKEEERISSVLSEEEILKNNLGL